MFGKCAEKHSKKFRHETPITVTHITILNQCHLNSCIVLKPNVLAKKVTRHLSHKTINLLSPIYNVFQYNTCRIFFIYDIMIIYICFIISTLINSSAIFLQVYFGSSDYCIMRCKYKLTTEYTSVYSSRTEYNVYANMEHNLLL